MTGGRPWLASITRPSFHPFLLQLLGPLRRSPVIAGALGYLVLVLIRYSSVWQGGGLMVGGPSDNEQHIWELGWWGFALTHGTSPFLTHYLRPDGAPLNLMWNNAMPLVATVAAPIVLLLGALTTFNLLVIAAVWGSATTAFLCLRPLAGGNLSAWTAGLFFAFSPLMIVSSDSAHLPWLMLVWVPLLLTIYLRLLQGHAGWRLGLILGLLMAGQLLTSEEVAADSLLMITILSVLLALTHRRRVMPTLRTAIPTLALALAVCLVVCAYPLLVQFAGPGHVRGPSTPNLGLVSDLAGFALPTQYQLLNLGGLLPRFQEAQTFAGSGAAYLGVPLLILLVYMGIRQWADSTTRWSLVLVASAMILSLGRRLVILGHPTGIPLPWALLRHLPLFQLIIPDRLTLFVYLGVAVLIARFAYLEWPKLSPGFSLIALVAGLATLAPAAGWYSATSTPAFFTGPQVAKLTQGTLAVVAPGGSIPALGADMLWQVDANFRFRMTWGYLIQPSPKGRAELMPHYLLGRELAAVERGQTPDLTQANVSRLRGALLTWGVRYVIVARQPHEEAETRLLSTVLRRAPRDVGGIELWTIRRGAGWSGYSGRGEGAG